jgi:cobalt-zinc-cadmium resistance protein CzcA
MVAVPLLFLIFIVFRLWINKRSFNGVFSNTTFCCSIILWMRGLPFSISRSRFIALFGIAVLNGIVLIEHFKELKHQGMKSIDELILKGTTDRLRPVLLTLPQLP